MHRNAILFAALVTAVPANAQAVHTYGDTLIDGLVAAHRDIGRIEIRSTAKDGTPIKLERGQPNAAAEKIVPLENSMGEKIGELAVTFHGRRHVSAEAVAHEASRKIYLANNLVEPDPFVAGAHRSKLGQRIVDSLMTANPDLVTLGLHVGKSGADNAILASNFGRIGKPGDKDDAKVIDGGQTLKEPTNGGKRLAVSLPLLDRKGRVVGSLSTSFLVGPGGFDAASARAVVVRDQAARQIESLDQLMR